MTRVRVRGIYTTALTRLLEADATIVDASGPIERRFDRAFPVAEPAVRVRTTEDRQGVGLHGEPAAVDSVADRLASVGIDALAWAESAALGRVTEAAVTETLGSGAVVDLGSREGFLPYDETPDRIEVGDSRRVQVRDPAPPWADRRPVVGTTVRVDGLLADLVRGETGVSADVADRAERQELARTTDVLSVDPPEGWGLRWAPPATDADLEALETAVSTLRERATQYDDGADAATATTWVWFGRASRFALDEARREVTETLAGHHRIKVGSERASVAVDFAERLGAGSPEFDFEAVADTFGPAAGERIEIHHGKPDGRCYSLGTGAVLDREDSSITVRRELSGGGTYDALGVPKSAGDTATTTFQEGRWWYPTTYRDADGDPKGTYLNVCTPIEIFPDAVRYVDLHVDVVRHADGTIERVDEAELEEAVAAGDLSEDLAARARDVAEAVERAIG